MGKLKGDLGKITACFRCGTIKPETESLEHGVKCTSCGEINTVATLYELMDLINLVYLHIDEKEIKRVMDEWNLES